MYRAALWGPMCGLFFGEATMIVIARLLEQQFPFQSVLVQAMSRIDLALAVSDNPDSLTFKDEDFDGCAVGHGVWGLWSGSSRYFRNA